MKFIAKKIGGSDPPIFSISLSGFTTIIDKGTTQTYEVRADVLKSDLCALRGEFLSLSAYGVVSCHAINATGSAVGVWLEGSCSAEPILPAPLPIGPPIQIEPLPVIEKPLPVEEIEIGI